MLSRQFPKIPVYPKQLAMLASGSCASRRGNLIPDLELPISKFLNVDFSDKETKVKNTRLVDVPADRLMMGVISPGVMSVRNSGPYATKVDLTGPGGSDVRQEQILAVGDEIHAFFEGHAVLVVMKATECRSAKGRIGFDRYILSNFLDLDALPLGVDGSDVKIKAGCVEIPFQIIKAVLTGDLSVLKEALEQTSCPKLKKFMNKAQGIPAKWFESVNGDPAMNQKAMEWLQAWCITCECRFNVLCKIMTIFMEHGVLPEDVEIYEYNGDTNYGTGTIDGDFAPLLEDDFIPKGKNILGSIVTSLARQAIKGSHADYVNWFNANYPNLFELKPEPAQEERTEEDKASVLGARLASVADLPPPPAPSRNCSPTSVSPSSL